MNNSALNQLLHIGSFAVFLILLSFFGILSVILSYHWTRYGVSEENIKKARIIYFGVSAILLFVAAISLIFIFLKEI